MAKEKEKTGVNLSALAQSNKELEAAERSKSASKLGFISLLSADSAQLDPKEPAYIKGAKAFDFVVPSRALVLGQSFDVTVLAMFKLYAETAKKDGDDIAKTVGFWMPEDAECFPVEGFFNRPLPNGNVLMPVHWVFCYLHDYPDVDDAVITFKSTGNSIYADLAKLVKAESEICTQLRFTVTKQGIKNDKYKKTFYYPKFEITGRNFNYTDEEVTPVKGGLKEAEIAVILTRSNKLQSDYAQMRLVASKKETANKLLTGFSAVPALGYDEGEKVKHKKAASF